MKTFTKLFLLITLTLLTLAFAACGEAEITTDGANTHTTTEEITTAPETTLSAEELLMKENQAYLDSLTYADYTLTGKNEPHYVGRWFEKSITGKSHTVTVTDGSQIYFMVEGAASVDVTFTKITVTETPYFAYSIDGSEPVRQLITNPTVTLPDSGKHTLCIVADGMTEGENKWNGEIGFAVKSIKPSEGGKLYGIKPTGKTVFFYGDSITEGIRALSMDANSNGNSATHAYPWYAAKKLGFTPYFVGYGATGLVKTGSFNTFIQAIDQLSAKRTVESSPIANVTPDLIVVNHGTNDGLGGVSITDYEAALRTAIARLQEKYPGVKIVYLVPFLEATDMNFRRQGMILDNLAKELDGLYVVHTKDWALSYTDGNLHPNAAGAEKAGEKLADALITLLGENFFA